jgi:hypothetical protein
MVVEKPHHLFMGLKGTIETTRSDILRGFGQTGVDDAALLGGVLVVGGGKLGAIDQRLRGENDSAALDGCFDEVSFSHARGGAKAAGKGDLTATSNFHKCRHLREA